MAKKDLIELIDENMLAMGWVSLRIARAQKGRGLARQDLKALVCLYVDGRILFKDLAKFCDMQPPNLSVLLKRLEKNGLVKREEDKRDRRKTWYSLSAKGVKFTETELGGLNSVIEEIFGVLGKSDKEKMIESLAVVNEILFKLKADYGTDTVKNTV